MKLSMRKPAFTENEVPLLCSKKPVIGPCPVPDESIPCPYIFCLEDLFYYYAPIYV